MCIIKLSKDFLEDNWIFYPGEMGIEDAGMGVKILETTFVGGKTREVVLILNGEVHD